MAAKKIRKAVFPVAGMGTRFLPATKAVPKELLPIVDRPLIQYAVDEAIEAGIETMIFVNGRGKGAIEDHFDMAYELERTQADRGKDVSALKGTRLTPGNAVFVRQQEPLGLGHAIWCARDIVGDEPFAILLPDEFMHGKPGKGCLKQMVDAYEEVGGNLITLFGATATNGTWTTTFAAPQVAITGAAYWSQLLTWNGTAVITSNPFRNLFTQ